MYGAVFLDQIGCAAVVLQLHAGVEQVVVGAVYGKKEYHRAHSQHHSHEHPGELDLAVVGQAQEEYELQITAVQIAYAVGEQRFIEVMSGGEFEVAQVDYGYEQEYQREIDRDALLPPDEEQPGQYNRQYDRRVIVYQHKIHLPAGLGQAALTDRHTYYYNTLFTTFQDFTEPDSNF